MGKNMQNMLAFATANSGWHNVHGWDPTIKDKRANTRALESLVQAGKLKQRTLKSGEVQFSIAGRRSTSSKGPKGEAVNKGPTRLDQAVEYARANPGIKRCDLMSWLQSSLGMSKQGSSTYVQLTRKVLKDEAAGVVKVKTPRVPRASKTATATGTAIDATAQATEIHDSVNTGIESTIEGASTIVPNEV